MPIKTLLGFMHILILLVSPSLSAADWQLKTDKQGIKVYTKDIANTNLKAFRGVTTVDAEFTKLVGLLEEVAFFPQWMHDVKSAKIVKKVSDIEQYAHVVQSAPVIKNRDFVAKALVSQDPKTLSFLIKVSTTPEGERLVPQSKNYVRMKRLDAYYKFTPLNQGKQTLVEMQVMADPAGSIPDSIVNLAAVRTPFQTLRNIKRLNLNDDRFIPTCVEGFEILGQACR